MTVYHPLPTLDRHLRGPLLLADPQAAGALALFPIFGPEPELFYRTFPQARVAGFTIGELAGAPSVNEVLVDNPTESPVLLYDGEEIQGARQNRTIDGTFLVPARARLSIPVSCVEQRRWDSGFHVGGFSPAPQAASPALRIAGTADREAATRADQARVWSDVRQLSDRLAVDSPTAAMHDVYETHRDRLVAAVSSLALHEGQIGALVAIGGEFAILDLVSRPDAFAALHDPLCQGYALDALDRQPAPPPAPEDARVFLDHALDAIAAEHDTIGLGRALRITGERLRGTGLAHAGELVQVTIFPDGGTGDSRSAPALPARIMRPSRRFR